jgi:hypothetical protein
VFDCSASGRAFYSAWYELVPAAAHTIRMKVRPGDRIASAVTVSGRHVTLTLRNRTSGKSFQRRATMTAPDVSSAEWIVEAPAACNASGRCEQLPQRLPDDDHQRQHQRVDRNGKGHAGDEP